MLMTPGTLCPPAPSPPPQRHLAALIAEAAFPPVEASPLYDFARTIISDIADMVPKVVGGLRKAAGLPQRCVVPIPALH